MQACRPSLGAASTATCPFRRSLAPPPLLSTPSLRWRRWLPSRPPQAQECPPSSRLQLPPHQLGLHRISRLEAQLLLLLPAVRQRRVRSPRLAATQMLLRLTARLVPCDQCRFSFVRLFGAEGEQTDVAHPSCRMTKAHQLLFFLVSQRIAKYFWACLRAASVPSRAYTEDMQLA